MCRAPSRSSSSALFIGLFSVWAALRAKSCHQPHAPYLRNHPLSVLHPAQPRPPYPVSSQAHNCTSHVVSPFWYFWIGGCSRRTAKLGKIKKLNKQVALKHTSLSLTKTLRYSLSLFWRALRNNTTFFFFFYFEEKNRRKPTISPTWWGGGGNGGGRGWNAAKWCHFT